MAPARTELPYGDDSIEAFVDRHVAETDLQSSIKDLLAWIEEVERSADPHLPESMEPRSKRLFREAVISRRDHLVSKSVLASKPRVGRRGGPTSTLAILAPAIARLMESGFSAWAAFKALTSHDQLPDDLKISYEKTSFPALIARTRTTTAKASHEAAYAFVRHRDLQPDSDEPPADFVKACERLKIALTK